MKHVKELIIDMLRDQSGYLPLTTESSPEQIRGYFGFDFSKEEFDQSIDELAREGLIELDGGGVSLVVEKTLSGAKFRKIKRRRR